MSRTHRGKKPPGYDYWSRRPGNGGHGKDAKDLTHSKERMLDKKIERDSEINPYEDCDDDWSDQELKKQGVVVQDSLERMEIDQLREECKKSKEDLEKLKAEPLREISYETLQNELERLPLTWYPGLILHLVELSYNKKIFLPGGASRIIHQWESRNSKCP